MYVEGEHGVLQRLPVEPTENALKTVEVWQERSVRSPKLPRVLPTYVEPEVYVSKGRGQFQGKKAKLSPSVTIYFKYEKKLQVTYFIKLTYYTQTSNNV